MAPLVVQLAAFAACWLAGRIGVLPGASSPVGALRYAFAVMFLFTGATHFVPRTRRDLVRMVPPSLPAPAHLVTLTGLLEIAGAVGLLILPVARVAALALAALLLAMFPANVHADRAGLEIAGRRATPLRLRLPLQLFWIALLLWIASAQRTAGVAAGA
jgi:uncharacterized membrane protein